MTIEPTSVDDQSLARQARAGDFAALETLVRRWQVPLVRFLDRRVGNRADAEDLFQETFIRIQQSLERFDDRRSFKTWIYTIAWRLAANHLRDRKHQSNPVAMENQMDGSPSPLEEMNAADLHQNLWGIARKVLSEDQYTVLWLFYIEQFPPREIAAVTGRSWVAIKTALHRARRALEPHVRHLERTAS